jgi:hypothetical protein
VAGEQGCQSTGLVAGGKPISFYAVRLPCTTATHLEHCHLQVDLAAACALLLLLLRLLLLLLLLQPNPGCC